MLYFYATTILKLSASKPCDAVEGCKTEAPCDFYGDLRCGNCCGGIFV